MKKVLFFAAILAVASMTFVACGNKQENKEGEKAEQKAEGAKEDNKDATCEKKECCKVDRAEQAVRDLEAATTMEEIMAIEQKYEDLNNDSFTEEQQERIEKAVKKIMYGDYSAAKEEVEEEDEFGYDDLDEQAMDDYDKAYKAAKKDYDKAYDDAMAEYEKAYNEAMKAYGK